MIDVILFMLSLVIVGAIAYFNSPACKTIQTNHKLRREAQQDERLIAHLVRQSQDANHRYNMYMGMWATDNPELIRVHPKRTEFIRIGYPGEKL